MGRSRFTAVLVASLVGSTVILLTPSPAAADNLAAVTWLSSHTIEANRDGHVISLSSDGSRAFFETYDYDDPAASSTQLTDIETGSTTTLPASTRSISDDGRIVLGGGWGEPITVTDLSTGWTRSVDDSDGLTPIASADGSTLVVGRRADVDPAELDSVLLALEPVVGGERTDLGIAEASNPVLSNDGTTVLFPRHADGGSLLMWHDGTTTSIAAGGHPHVVSASADLTTFVYEISDGDDLTSVIWHDGVEQVLGAYDSMKGPAVATDDGTGVVWVNDTSIVRRDVASGEDELLVTLPPDGRVQELAVDGDGREIVYEPVGSTLPEGDSSDLVVRHADGSMENICCDGSNALWPHEIQMSADGRRVVFASRTYIADDDPECCNDEVYAWSADYVTPADPSVSIRDVQATEGYPSSLYVALSQPADHPVLVHLDPLDNDDVYLPATDVVIDPGEVMTEVPVVPWADLERGETDSATITIQSVDGATVHDGTARVTIQDAPPAEISVGDLARPEWNSDQWWSFPVTTDRYIRGSVVSFTTRDGADPLTGAKAGSDYKDKRYKVSFAWPSLRTTIDIRVLGDRLPERDETFRLDLIGVTNAVIGDGHAIGTILDDDTPLRVS